MNIFLNNNDFSMISWGVDNLTSWVYLLFSFKKTDNFPLRLFEIDTPKISRETLIEIQFNKSSNIKNWIIEKSILNLLIIRYLLIIIAISLSNYYWSNKFIYMSFSYLPCKNNLLSDLIGFWREKAAKLIIKWSLFSWLWRYLNFANLIVYSWFKYYYKTESIFNLKSVWKLR